MQTYTIEVADEFVPEFIAMLNTLPKESIQLKSSGNKKENSKTVVNDLSKFKRRDDLVNGDSDDIDKISWDYQLDSVLAMENTKV